MIFSPSPPRKGMEVDLGIFGSSLVSLSNYRDIMRYYELKYNLKSNCNMWYNELGVLRQRINKQNFHKIEDF